MSVLMDSYFLEDVVYGIQGTQQGLATPADMTEEFKVNTIAVISRHIQSMRASFDASELTQGVVIVFTDQSDVKTCIIPLCGLSLFSRTSSYPALKRESTYSPM